MRRPLLTTVQAEKLYDAVRNLPLIDYHNHLSVFDIWENRRYSDLYELWIATDPYKHRAMRICGIDEKYITGDADREDKFRAFCKIYPRLIGGALYDWCKIELEDVLGIQTPILTENAGRIWDETKEKLQDDAFRARSILRRFGTEYIAPCAGTLDSLDEYVPELGVSPSLRGDDITHPDVNFLKSMEEKTGILITGLDSYIEAIRQRIDLFHAARCSFSDHAIDDGFLFTMSPEKAEAAFGRVMSGIAINEEESMALMSYLLVRLADIYRHKGWTMQLHIGAMRKTSTRLRRVAGPAGGYAGIGNSISMQSITSMLDAMEQQSGSLPSIILYTLNPTRNASFAVLTGSFTGVTQGPAWWWCDHVQGMREMLSTYAVYSVLDTFPGMTTDSRSLLSLSRHDYFRRTLCDFLGKNMQQGEMPDSMDCMSELAVHLCYTNAKARIRA